MRGEKINRPVTICLQRTLYDNFAALCHKQYKSVSGVIRELVVEYVKTKKIILPTALSMPEVKRLIEQQKEFHEDCASQGPCDLPPAQQ